MESKWKWCHTAVWCEDEVIKYKFKLLDSDATHAQTLQTIKGITKIQLRCNENINDFLSFCESPGLSFADS